MAERARLQFRSDFAETSESPPVSEIPLGSGCNGRSTEKSSNTCTLEGLTGPAEVRPNVIVNIEQTGPNDYWGMLHTYSINEILEARVHDLESMLKAVMDLEKKNGEQCSVMYFMDLTGLKFDRKTSTLITGALASVSAFMAEHYVEMVHTFVLVNVPTFIHTIWTLARPLLPEKTKNKVHILGSNWREEVLKYANPEVLPSFWNQEEGEPFGADLQRAVPFPEEVYYKNEISEKAELFFVPAGKADHFDVIVDEGEPLEWKIDADGNFAFCIFKVENDHPNVSIDSMERVYPKFSKVPGPTIVPLSDSIKKPKPGRYRFWFSNEHAWFHTLKIRHTISPTGNEK